MIPLPSIVRSSCLRLAVALLLLDATALLGADSAASSGTAPALPVDAPIASTEFKDPETGARILRLSTKPGGPAGVIYFTQDCITPDNRYALVRYLEPSAGHTAGHMYRYDFTNGELLLLTDRMTKNQVLASRSGNLYYSSDNDRAVYVTNLLDLRTRKIADLPTDVSCSGGLTVSADESMIVGTGTLVREHVGEPILTTAPNHGAAFGDTFSRHDTNLLIGFDVKTGRYRELHRINTWLGHTQFSPTDPKLLMYCHEGPWAKVDRVWTLRIDDGSQPQLVLARTEEGEIAGHEFWSMDGSTIWYDHDFRGTSRQHFLEGKNLSTGNILRYPITPLFDSLHYTQSPDGRFFVADGHAKKEHPEQQAMFLLFPGEGKLRPVKLCSMAGNNYAAAEPNPHLTPDQRRVLFTATFSGVPQAYAVEVPPEAIR